MNEQEQMDRSSGLTNGRLEGISVPDLLWGLCQSQRTGVLKITAEHMTTVYIDEGRIIFAASSDPDQRLGEMFLRKGLITLAQLERAIGEIGSGRRLGTILVEHGSIGPQDLVHGVMAQVESIILDLFPLEEGEYRFCEGPLPSEEVITLSMNTGEFLLQGLRKVRSFVRIRASVGPPRTAYRLTSSWERAIDGLELEEGERALIGRLNADGVTIEALCDEVFLSNFEIYQALWALKVLGVIEEVEWTFESVGRASFEGHLGPEGLPPVLVRLCRDNETGVLYVSRGTLERAFHISDGRCLFATSSNIDDGLVAHLLRRGVISLRDREETAKRLLSNKRVGTILREMGVIDDEDLARMVRDQLSEIVHDTFQWDQGDYAFVAGELPTIEEITLDRSLEDLILAGVRRVASWSRVVEGCGGLETKLELSAGYLKILDDMTVGQEEWDVVTAVRSPRTLHQICRECNLPDFLTCQVVWALKLLGVVRAAGATKHDSAADRAADERGATSDPVAADSPAPAFDGQGSSDEEREDESWGPEPSFEPETVTTRRSGRYSRVDGPDEPLGSDHADFASVEEPAFPEDDPYETATDELDVDPLVEESVSVDSPLDATQYISREEIERALRGPGSRPGVADPEDLRAAAAAGEEGTLADPVFADERAEIVEEETRAFELAQPDEIEPQDDPFAPRVGLGASPGKFAVEESAGVEPRDTMETPAGEPGVEAEAYGAGAAATGPDEPRPDASDLASDARTAVDKPYTYEMEYGIGDTQVVPPDSYARVGEYGPDDTVEIESPRERSVGTDPEGSEIPPGEDWSPPHDLERLIARFNAMQRLVYRSIRSEVGAGAANFVRSCGGQIRGRFGDLFSDVRLQPDGAWDPADLRRAIVDLRLEHPWQGFQELIDEEIERLQTHIGLAGAESLRGRLESLESPGQTARPPE